MQKGESPPHKRTIKLTPDEKRWITNVVNNKHIRDTAYGFRLEIVLMVSNSFTDIEIANQLRISLSTVQRSRLRWIDESNRNVPIQDRVRNQRTGRKRKPTKPSTSICDIGS